MDSCNFEENVCSDNGGAIYISSSSSCLILHNSIFKENSADVDGGAIYSNGLSLIFSSRFENNVATGATKKASYGGAIRSIGYSTYNDCSFENNSAYNYGGAVYADNEIRIGDSNFTGNKAKQAGAIYASIINEQVSNSIFDSNKATNGDGGAIYIYNKCSPDIVSCSFENNICNKRGAAIFLDSSRAPLKLSNCIFNYNKANDYGGAVYLDGTRCNYHQLERDTCCCSSRIQERVQPGSRSRRICRCNCQRRNPVRSRQGHLFK